jgi:cell division protein FtsQ
LLGSKKGRLEIASQRLWVMHLITWLAPSLVMVLFLGGGLFWLLRDHAAFHVATVRVYGAEQVSQAELMQRAQISRGMSLFRIDVERVRTRLMQHPWIREALVRRAYPNELEIVVYERRPAAILETRPGYLIDGTGHLLGQAIPAEWPSLPRLVATLTQTPSPGERITDPTVTAGLRLLDQAHESLFFRQTVITHIDIMSPERFLVQTRRGRFIVGASLAGVDDKLAFLPSIDEVLRTSARRAEYIDVSVENQIVVKTSPRATQGASRLQRRGASSGQTQ